MFGMKKNIAFFLVGCICGALMLGAAIVLKQIGEGIGSWGRTIDYSDIKVRQTIKESGVDLPPASWNLFYAISGFQDHGVWIALTVPRDQLWSVVEKSLHKNKADFASGIPKGFLDEVEMDKDQKIDTSLWTPKSINHPLHFSIRSNRNGSDYFEDWVVDEEVGRIFITKQNT